MVTKSYIWFWYKYVSVLHIIIHTKQFLYFKILPIQYIIINEMHCMYYYVQLFCYIVYIFFFMFYKYYDNLNDKHEHCDRLPEDAL